MSLTIYRYQSDICPGNICPGQRSAGVAVESWYWHLLPSIDWSWSQHPTNYPFSMSLSLYIQGLCQSLWVLVWTFSSLNESWSRHQRKISVSLSLGLNIQEISQSQWVLVSTSYIYSSLDESHSWHPRNFAVLMSLIFDIQEILSLDETEKLSQEKQI